MIAKNKSIVPQPKGGSSVGRCMLCARGCEVDNSVKCALCCEWYHRQCVTHPPESVLICPISLVM